MASNQAMNPGSRSGNDAPVGEPRHELDDNTGAEWCALILAQPDMN